MIYSLPMNGFIEEGLGGLDGLDGALNLTISSNGNHVYVISSENDSVSWYSRKESNGALTYGGFLKDGVNGVDGLDYPCEVSISPDGKHVYVIAANDNAISWFTRNSVSGELTYGGYLEDGFNIADSLEGASSITFSANGEYAYATATNNMEWSSGKHSISWYARNTSTGALAFEGILKDGESGVDGLGGAVKAFMSPDGSHLYVAA